MNTDKPVIAVIGAGAVGGYYGARLAQHGYEVHMLMRHDADVVRKSGLRVQSRDGDFFLPPEKLNVYTESSAMPPSDLVLVTLKTTANHLYEPLIAPVLKSDSTILTLQNGLGNEQRLAELFGVERILGGMAFVCINRGSPGEIIHMDHGIIRMGEFHGPATDRVRAICRMFSDSLVPCQPLDDLAAGRWDKLVWNVPFNGLGAALDLTTDRIIGDPQGLELVRSLMREVIAACQPLGIRLNPSIIEEKIRYTRTMGAYRSSMQIDRQMNRPLELDAIIGKPLQVAHNNAVLTPYMKMLYDLVKLVDPSALSIESRHANSTVCEPHV